ncbi:Os04g0224200, partial [Oryza sativa Japonica Group]
PAAVPSFVLAASPAVVALAVAAGVGLATREVIATTLTIGEDLACAATTPTATIPTRRERGAGAGACNQHRRCEARDAQLLQQEGIACRCEARENGHAYDVISGVGEVIVEASEKVEHKLGVGDGVVDVAKGVGSGLHLLQ